MWIKYENFVRQQEQNYRIIVEKALYERRKLDISDEEIIAKDFLLFYLI